jgi:Sec-independent protein translocase protein TatA
VIGVQELALIAVIVFLLCGPWIVRRIGASLAALRELGQ